MFEICLIPGGTMHSKYSYQKIVTFFSIILGITFSGCRGQLNPGHYEGSLLQNLQEEVLEQAVKIEVKKLNNTAISIEIKNSSGIRIAKASVRRSKRHQIEIESDLLSKYPILANRVESNDPEKYDNNTRCYSTYSSVSIEFCFRKDRFLLQVVDQSHNPILRLSANAFEEEKKFELEKPVKLDLTKAIALAFAQNFDSKIAYEHVLQARYAAMAAYLNLVPHLTSNLIWNAAPNYITFIATLQGLAPFLLPSYWFQAKEASIDKEVKELSLIIMRANLATTTEELTYSLQRDTSIVSSEQSFMLQVLDFQTKVIQSTISEHPKTHLLELAQFILESLQSDLGDMSKLIRQDRYSLAQTLGYHNIEAIETIRIDQENLTIEQASKLSVDPHWMAGLASERSFELRQLDDLKRIAKLKKLENFFIWLDPTGDPKQSLGLNTIPQQAQASSQLREIEVQRDQLKTLIYQNAYKLALDYNEAIKSHGDIKRDLDVIDFNLDAVLSEVLNGAPVHLASLKDRAQKYVASLIARETSLANFRMARAKKDRYLLMGYYTQLLPKLQYEIGQNRLSPH